MDFYEPVTKRFSTEWFQKYATASVCEWLASLFQKQKKYSEVLRISLEWVFTELFQKNMRLFANRLIAVTEPTNHIIYRNDITTEH